MADYTKYDPRVDSLVVESKTLWDDAIVNLSDQEKQTLARTLHKDPAKATKIEYWRTHTGFTRQITVTAEDVARLQGK